MKSVVRDLHLHIEAPGYVRSPLRRLSFTVTREGHESDAYKEIVIWNDLHERTTMVVIPIRNGVFHEVKFLAKSIDGQRALFIYDFDSAPLAAVRTPSVIEDTEFKFDLNDGSGGGTEPTERAFSPARIRVEQVPESREVVALERKADGSWRYAGATRINATGLLDMQVAGGDVYVMAADDYGAPFQSNLQIDVGATIRPSRFQGWLYRCTEAGQLPADEPEWWPEQGDNPARPVGTARLQAVRYYQPIAHGPIKYELV